MNRTAPAGRSRIDVANPGMQSASEIGHFAPGVLGIRDLVVPEPGFYGVLYNYYYSTERLNDADGHKVDSVTINPGPGPGVTLDLDVDVGVYAIAPTFIWVSDKKLFGAKYGAYISPSFSDSSVAASLTTATGSGRNVSGSHFDVADLFVQPLWLGWTKEHWDFAAGLRVLCADRPLRHGNAHSAGHRPDHGRSVGQHRPRLLDAPVPGGGQLVSLGRPADGGSGRPDLRDQREEGRLRPDAGRRADAQLGRGPVPAVAGRSVTAARYRDSPATVAGR